MKLTNLRIYIFLISFFIAIFCYGQLCEPYGICTGTEGSSERLTLLNRYTGSAPLSVKFFANPNKDCSPDVKFEWHFIEDSNPKKSFLIRYEQNTEFTFLRTGSYKIILYELLGNDTIQVYDPLIISISESELSIPNAFSPNGDGINDIYRVKKGFKSIVDFRAIIFNRWGVKLYEWDSPLGGWDGKYKGKNVPEGVYYVIVKAKGADGRIFNIRSDVNLLRSFEKTQDFNR